MGNKCQICMDQMLVWALSLPFLYVEWSALIVRPINDVWKALCKYKLQDPPLPLLLRTLTLPPHSLSLCVCVWDPCTSLILSIFPAYEWPLFFSSIFSGGVSVVGKDSTAHTSHIFTFYDNSLNKIWFFWIRVLRSLLYYLYTVGGCCILDLYWVEFKVGPNHQWIALMICHNPFIWFSRRSNSNGSICVCILFLLYVTGM